MKNSLPLQQTLIELLDLRNVYEAEKLYHEYSDSALEAAEQKINNLAMSIIMKMNDKSFRPIFVRIVDWATTPMTTNRKALERRTISFFKFYEVFNDQLKVRICTSKLIEYLKVNSFSDNRYCLCYICYQNGAKRFGTSSTTRCYCRSSPNISTARIDQKL